MGRLQESHPKLFLERLGNLFRGSAAVATYAGPDVSGRLRRIAAPEGSAAAERDQGSRPGALRVFCNSLHSVFFSPSVRFRIRAPCLVFSKRATDGAAPQ